MAALSSPAWVPGRPAACWHLWGHATLSCSREEMKARSASNWWGQRAESCDGEDCFELRSASNGSYKVLVFVVTIKWSPCSCLLYWIVFGLPRIQWNDALLFPYHFYTSPLGFHTFEAFECFVDSHIDMLVHLHPSSFLPLPIMLICMHADSRAS